MHLVKALKYIHLHSINKQFTLIIYNQSIKSHANFTFNSLLNFNFQKSFNLAKFYNQYNISKITRRQILKKLLSTYCQTSSYFVNRNKSMHTICLISSQVTKKKFKFLQLSTYIKLAENSSLGRRRACAATACDYGRGP